MMLAALTGATGFLGRHLLTALDRAGFRVRVLVSRPDAAFQDAPADLETVVGRLEHPDALRRLADGAEVLIQNAGLTKAVSREAFFEANATGARRAAEASDARFILVSSISAREPQLSAYAASKAAGETAVREALPADRLTIVRPCAIYGPGDLQTLDFLRAIAGLPLLPLPGSPSARLTMIHGADAAAQIAALAGRTATGAVYALADARAEGYPLREIMQTAAAALNRRARLVHAPSAVMLAAGALGGLAGRLTGQAAFFTLGKARELLHPDWSVAPGDLPPGAPPIRFDLAAGMADSVMSWKTLGRL